MKMPLDQQATKDIELNVLREWFILTKKAHDQGPPRSGLVLQFGMYDKVVSQQITEKEWIKI